MIAITYIVLAVAGALFGFRLAAGPSLANWVIGVDGMIGVGMSAIIINAMDTLLPEPLESCRYELCTANSLPEACIEVEIICG